AARATVTYRLQSRARVTIQVVDADGAVVRRAVTNEAQKAGPKAWSWNGKVTGGTYAKPGTYRIVVSATNGTQRAAQSASVMADAFRLAASVSTAVRGKSFTLTARSAEPLSTTPVIVVREAGVDPWTITMTRASGSTWTASVTPRRHGSADSLALTVKARDDARGWNRSVLRLAFR
ncbi:MAG TPA: FlgD immunoglobulin-like domain containing protein, partial [Candidatus Limnocylindrales bacterium]